MRHLLQSIFGLVTGLVLFNSCSAQLPAVNTSHLDHLYEEMVLETGDSVGIIHIYAEYPDYHFVGDDDEGIACVDDVARAAIFYLKHAEQTGHMESLRKAHMLMEFILTLQSDNGYFYNFIWADGSIHKEGITTKNEPNWWSWRALWCLTTFIESPLLDNYEKTADLVTARQRLIDSMLEDQNDERKYFTVSGIDIPEWLPSNAATDQAALILMGLSPMADDDPAIASYVKSLAEGIVLMQLHSPSNWFDGAFLCWQNIWHGYGSSQAYALLLASQTIDEGNYRQSALYEINQFYPALWKKGWLSSFVVEKNQQKLSASDIKVYDQIAYGLRPAIWACGEAYRITGDNNYTAHALVLFSWFTGNNPAGITMYDEETGRGYDGIINDTTINKNSGAESTIEALLSLQMLHSIINQ